PRLLQGQAQQGQGGAVAVVAALVGHTGALRAVGHGTGLFYGKRVKVSPKGHAARSPAPAQGVKPASPVYQFQMGMLLKKGHQPGFGPRFLSGQLWMGVELVAQRSGQPITGIHHWSFPFSFLSFSSSSSGRTLTRISSTRRWST